MSVDYFLKDAPHAYKPYFVEVEYANRIQKMTSTTRVALLNIMDQLIAIQNAPAVSED